MKIYFFIFSLFLCCNLFSQNDILEELYNKYEDDCLSIDINVPNWLKKHVVDDIDEPGTREAIRKAKRFKLLIIDENLGWKRDASRLKRSMAASNYDELIRIRDEGEITVFLSDFRDEMGLKDLIFCIEGSDHDGILLSLKGTFSQRDIDRILDDIHINCN